MRKIRKQIRKQKRKAVWKQKRNKTKPFPENSRITVMQKLAMNTVLIVHINPYINSPAIFPRHLSRIVLTLFGKETLACHFLVLHHQDEFVVRNGIAVGFSFVLRIINSNVLLG